MISAIGPAIWLVAAAGLEVTLCAGLAVWLLTRSAALAAWWTGAAGCLAGWVTYAVAAGPWAPAGEFSLALPAALLTLLWPLAHGR